MIAALRGRKAACAVLADQGGEDGIAAKQKPPCTGVVLGGHRVPHHISPAVRQLRERPRVAATDREGSSIKKINTGNGPIGVPPLHPGRSAVLGPGCARSAGVRSNRRSNRASSRTTQSSWSTRPR